MFYLFTCWHFIKMLLEETSNRRGGCNYSYYTQDVSSIAHFVHDRHGKYQWGKIKYRLGLVVEIVTKRICVKLRKITTAQPQNLHSFDQFGD